MIFSAMRRISISFFILVVGFAADMRVWAYTQYPTPLQLQPYDAALPNGIVVKIPQSGIDFLAAQLESGLQGNSLRNTIVEALEGQYFQIVLPIFGGNLRLTVPCSKDNPNRTQVIADANFAPPAMTRPWCPYLTYADGTPPPPVIAGQVALPTTLSTLQAFRYQRVAIEVATYPIADLATPQANSAFAALYLLEKDGKHAQLDVVPDHPLFIVKIPVNIPPGVDPATVLGDLADCYANGAVSLHLLGNGCSNTFVATLEADLVTGGQLRPYFENNVLYVLVNDFHTRLQNLKILTPITQNPAIEVAFQLCLPGCQAQYDQTQLLFRTVEQALGDVAMQLFERELNAALSDVLQDGINQLFFDRAKDGTPDPVLNLQALAAGINEMTPLDFAFNFAARYESSPSAPAEMFFVMDGGLYSTGVSRCVDPAGTPAFRYTYLEVDGNAGHDPPKLDQVIPGLGIPYQIGASFSDDLLNQVLYNMWLAGLFCVSLSPHSQALPPGLADLLTTDSFAPFVKWLPELAPHAPVIVQITPKVAPYLEFGQRDDGSLLRVVAPAVDVDVYVEMGSGAERRPLRAFGLWAAITAAVDIKAINFSKKPFIDLTVAFESGSRVAFNDLKPEENQKLAGLMTGVLDLMAPQLAKMVGDIEIPLVSDCIGGLQQKDLALRTSGRDPKTGLDHYLDMYFNFTGTFDFRKIFMECLLTIAAAPVEPISFTELGAIAMNPLTLDPLRAGVDISRPYRWRLDGGFWHRSSGGAWGPRQLLDGPHHLEFEQDGRIFEVRFYADGTAPILRTRLESNRLWVEGVDRSPVQLRVNDGAWQAGPRMAVRLRPGSHVVHVTARDAVGHITEMTTKITVTSPSYGCQAADTAAFVWSAWLLLAWSRHGRHYARSLSRTYHARTRPKQTSESR